MLTLDDQAPAKHMSKKRIDAREKRLINCNTVDVNQLMPLKYKWA